MKKKYPVSFFFLIILVVIFVYQPGLSGSFIFDDFSNLQPLGVNLAITDWNTAIQFITTGFSGPTGRPISLASFLLNDNTWPSYPYSFKYTNLMIHLLNGVLLSWAILLLLRTYSYSERKSVWIALVASSIWLLHPYFVSTTLYVVQRMAQLATLFTLIGIIGYLKARLLLVQRSMLAYVYMTLSIGICTILATYSKENGALLPLLILVLEYCNPNKNYKPIWQWRAVCLWIPTFAVLYLIFREINFSENLWPNRNFNQVERLLSESRIVTEYLFHLFVPQIEGRGLYQDGYEISTSLFQPITTLYSIVFLFTLSCFAFILRKKYPLFSVAVLFFLAAHLMESTVIGLELYFEHRNYLSALLLFLPIASGVYILSERIDNKIIVFIVFIILSLLSFFTYERARLWGDTNRLLLYWAEKSPNSARAQAEIAKKIAEQGYILESNLYLEQAIKNMPDSSLLNMQLLLQKISYNLASNKDFEETIARFKKQPFDAQAIQGLRMLTDGIIDNKERCSAYCNSTLQLIYNLDTHSNYKDFSVYKRLSAYLKAKLYLATQRPEQAFQYYQKAMRQYKDIEVGLTFVTELAVKGEIVYALEMLQLAKEMYVLQGDKSLKRSRKIYDQEIVYLEKMLKSEL